MTIKILPFFLLIQLWCTLLNALPADELPLNNSEDNSFPTTTTPVTNNDTRTPRNVFHLNSTTSPASTTLTNFTTSRNATTTTPPFVAKYAVRWQSPQRGQFGATFNFSFNDEEAFRSKDWLIRFRFQDINGTALENYWGSWKAVDLTKGWYLLLPNKSRGELDLDERKTVYFSFNGRWNANSDWNTDKIAVEIFELQVKESEDSVPLVKDLTSVNEFENMPIPFTVPDQPFGPFVRTSLAAAVPQKLFGAASSSTAVKYPTKNTFGMMLCLPVLAFFIGILLTGTINRQRSRLHFRQQLKERDLQRNQASVAVAAATASMGTEKKSTPSDRVFTGSNRLSMFPKSGGYVGEGGALGEVLESYTQRSLLLNPGAEYRRSVHPSFESRLSRPPLPRAPPQSEATSTPSTEIIISSPPLTK